MSFLNVSSSITLITVPFWRTTSISTLICVYRISVSSFLAFTRASRFGLQLNWPFHLDTITQQQNNFAPDKRLRHRSRDLTWVADLETEPMELRDLNLQLIWRSLFVSDHISLLLSPVVSELLQLILELFRSAVSRLINISKWKNPSG